MLGVSFWGIPVVGLAARWLPEATAKTKATRWGSTGRERERERGVRMQADGEQEEEVQAKAPRIGEEF